MFNADISIVGYGRDGATATRRQWSLYKETQSDQRKEKQCGTCLFRIFRNIAQHFMVY
jgi:hypothetical protein